MAIITISRGSLSGGELLAKQLSDKLNARLISREVVINAAKRYGVSEEKLNEEMSNPPGLWDRLTHHKERYILAIQAMLAEMVEEGNVIYQGLVGQILLGELSRVINIRLLAPMEHRIRVAMLSECCEREEAIEKIEAVDRRREKWVRQIYNVELSDPRLYDLVLNLDSMSIDTAAELVVDLAGRKEYRRTKDMDRERKNFALRKRVEAELMFNSTLPREGLDFKVHRGRVIFAMTPAFDKHQRDVVEFVSSIEGVKHVIGPGDETLHRAPKIAHAEKRATDIMLPADEYPHLYQDVSIREAIVAMTGSSVELEDGHILTPRYILVYDKMEQLVGVVARRSLMRGLNPQLTKMQEAQETAEAIAHVDHLSAPMLFQWDTMFSEAAIAAASAPIQSIMSPIKGTVRASDDLSVVVTTMLQHAVDLLPVVDGQKAVGVVLMTDVFDAVAQFIMESDSILDDHDADTD